MKRMIPQLSVFVCLACIPASLLAGEPPLEFLHALQANGYPDLAVTYLKNAQASGKMSNELKDVWDLEMAKSLQEQAKRDDRQRTALVAEAEKYLNKFLKEKPKHPRAVSAIVAWGDFQLDRASRLLDTAAGLSDKEKAQVYDDVRKAISEAKPKYLGAIPKFQAQLAALRVPENPSTAAEKAAAAEIARQRQQTEAEWLNARFQAALCDYYLGQTYPNPKDPKRKAALQAAAKAFDMLWQSYRMTDSGLFAHMWHGRTMDELGNFTTAIDIYEEVLAQLPDPNKLSTPSGLEPLFTQVQYFRVLILAKQQRPSDFMPDVMEWLEDYKKLKDTDGYQGVALEAAKIRLRQEEKARGAEKQKFHADALRLLAEVSRERSAYQSEAILLRRNLTRAEGDVSQVTNVDEAMALGGAAAGAENWAEAAAAYARALELVGSTDSQRAMTVRQQLGLAKLMLAQDMLDQGQFLDCYAAAEKLMTEYQSLPQGPAAAVLAIKAAMNAIGTVPPAEQLAAVERLEKIASRTIETWPNKPESDEGLLALGQACLLRGKVNDAIAYFAKVHPNSDRYPLALLVSGQTLFRRHQAAKAAQGAGGRVDAKQMESDLQQSAEMLAKSAELQRKATEAARSMPRQLLETQLLLAEVKIEAGQAEEAEKLLTPLVAEVEDEKEADNTTLRVLLRALQVYCEANDRENADKVAAVLLKTGPDGPYVNLGLLAYVKLLRDECEKGEAAIASPSVAEDKKALDAAKKKLAVDKKAFHALLKALAQRQQTPVGGLVFVADVCTEAGLMAEAKAIYERVLGLMATDAQAKKAEVRVRSQLVGLLRKEGNFKAAIEQADELVKKTQGRALEPLMEQARIRQLLAKRDPSQYDEALKHWARLRNLMQGMRKRPPEYFEACYAAAECLLSMSKLSGDADAAKKQLDDAEKLLKATLVLSPQLSGPGMVAKYNSLLESIDRAQAREKPF